MKLKLFIAFVMIGALFCAVKIGAQPGHGETTSPPLVQFKTLLQPLQPIVDCRRVQNRIDENRSETYDPNKFYKTKIKSYQTFLHDITSGPAEARVVDTNIQCKFEFEHCEITAIVKYDTAEALYVTSDERGRFIALAGNFNAVKLCDTIKTAFATNKYVKLWYRYFGTANSIAVYSAELVNE